MIRETIAIFTKQVDRAARRNRHKDERPYWRYSDMPPGAVYIKGWANYDLKEKLKEEVKEFLENPSAEEAGDVGWIVAMMLDQLTSKEGGFER